MVNTTYRCEKCGVIYSFIDIHVGYVVDSKKKKAVCNTCNTEEIRRFHNV